MAEIAAGTNRIGEPLPAAAHAVSGDAAAHGATIARGATTVEQLLYALLFLAALGARLLLLGAAPMATHEAAAAWAAWMDATALHPTAAPATTSALLHALQTFTFWITGGSNETLARLPVALISSTIALLPWFWRDRLGRTAALLLAVLLALDPWLLAFGRMADATALSAALALIALTAMHVATRDPADGASRPVAVAVAAAGVGLLLVSGPQAWSWLPMPALYLLWVAEDRGAMLTVRAGAIAAGAALLGATGWFAWPQELAMVGASLGEWIGAFRAGPYNLIWPATRLLVDQPFLLVFGLVGFVALWIRPTDDPNGRLFLTLWLAWATLLLLLPGRVPGMLPLLALPLAVSAALLLQWLLQNLRATSEWGEAGLLALVLVAALLSVLFWAAQSLVQSAPATAGGLIAPLLLVMVALLVAAFAWFVSPHQALVVTAGVVALFLLAATLTSARHLAYWSEPAQPDGLFATTTWHDAMTLREDVRALSDRRTGYPTELPVQVVTGPTRTADPLVGWLLRDMVNLSFVSAPLLNSVDNPARTPLVVMASGGDQAGGTAWTDAFLGRTVRLRASWLPADLPSVTNYESGEQRWNAGWRPHLRWLLYRAAPTLPIPETVDLWAAPQ
jgi:hypothetical protein